MTSATAIDCKDRGNRAYKLQNYKEAERLYSIAIQKDPSNATFFTNRAMARIKLQSWELCLNDCLESIERNADNMKGYFYLAEAQLALKHPNEAVNSALTAYDYCLKTGSSSTPNVVALVLRAKKEKWEARERERLRQRSELLAELEDSLTRNEAQELEEVGQRREEMEIDGSAAMEDMQEIQMRSKQKKEELRSLFAIADPSNMTQRQEVPEAFIDNITFAFMHDPVMTRSGHSYERATIEAHLKASPTDPLTREPLRKEDLRPNLALKQACAEFLEHNGWAVDW